MASVTEIPLVLFHTVCVNIACVACHFQCRKDSAFGLWAKSDRFYTDVSLFIQARLAPV